MEPRVCNGVFVLNRVFAPVYQKNNGPELDRIYCERVKALELSPLCNIHGNSQPHCKEDSISQSKIVIPCKKMLLISSNQTLKVLVYLGCSNLAPERYRKHYF